MPTSLYPSIRFYAISWAPRTSLTLLSGTPEGAPQKWKKNKSRIKYNNILKRKGLAMEGKAAVLVRPASKENIFLPMLLLRWCLLSSVEDQQNPLV